MIRRSTVFFVTAVALLAALAVPCAASAQPGKTPRIGWLSPATAVNGSSNLDALKAGLRVLGYVEGKNLTIEARWADGDTPRLARLAAELVGLKVDVICTAGTQAAQAAKDATAKVLIPVVFANVAFPDRSGLVTSYARPGGNITGVAFIGPEYGKRLELLREAVPKLKRVGLIYNPDNKASVLAREETLKLAQGLHVTIDSHALRGPNDLNPVFAELAKRRPDALMTTADPLIASYRKPITDFARRERLPSIYPGREFVEAGGMMFYGGSVPEMYRLAAVYIDRILKGAKPSELPVEQPIKFDMAVNLDTARALGLTLPPSMLLRADEVIGQ